jgi:hypothetical protein
LETPSIERHGDDNLLDRQDDDGLWLEDNGPRFLLLHDDGLRLLDNDLLQWMTMMAYASSTGTTTTYLMSTSG